MDRRDMGIAEICNNGCRYVIHLSDRYALFDRPVLSVIAPWNGGGGGISLFREWSSVCIYEEDSSCFSILLPNTQYNLNVSLVKTNLTLQQALSKSRYNLST